MAAPTTVVIHPIVLLSVVDHYNRVAKDTRKRVVGVLLGERERSGKVDITNSFAVPFEEDLRNPDIWYLDHDFLETMYGMHRKISAKEKIIGFYSTGPKIRPADIEIDALMRDYCPQPVLVIIDVRPHVEGLPTQSFYSTEEVKEGKETKLVFRHVPCEVGAYEAEEVGVEHLLRDINDPSISTLAGEVKHKMAALRGLEERLQEIKLYLQRVVDGELPVNNAVLADLQAIFNLLPNLKIEKLVRAFTIKTNDMHLVMYLASLIRSITSLHDLVNNKLRYREAVVDGDDVKSGAGKGKGKAKDGEEDPAEAGDGDKKPDAVEGGGGSGGSGSAA